MCDLPCEAIINHKINNISFKQNSPQQPPPNFTNKIATHAIIDTGATAHYINSQAPCVNKQRLSCPITVGLPNGNHLIGHETAELKLNLPDSAKRATVFPNMTNMSLLSVGALCDAGMTATFTQKAVEIYNEKHECVLVGNRDLTNGLWTLPLEPDKPQANNITKIKSMDNLMQYLHQALFSPTMQTLQNAITKGHLKSWPGLTKEHVKKYSLW